MKWNKLFLPAMITWVFAPVPVQACSSCGSGAADPVILNPLEAAKFYVGLNFAEGFQTVDENGDIRRDYGPDRRSRLEFAYAHRLTPEVFISIDSGLGENRRGSRSRTGLTDTTANLRWTARLQDVTEPWIPQVQFVLSHRFQSTRSLQDSRELYNLDSFGAGYDETFAGTDIWFGMLPFLFGGSFLFSQPWAEETRSGRLEVGSTQKWIGTIGAKPRESFKIIGGVVHEKRGGITLDGEDSPIPSEKKSNDLFLTLETLRVEDDNFRFTFSKKAALGANQNASIARFYTLAWMRTL